jgi:flagellar motor component MotA
MSKENGMDENEFLAIAAAIAGAIIGTVLGVLLIFFIFGAPR